MRKSDFRRAITLYLEMVRLLLFPHTTAGLIAEAGQSFRRSIRAALGPDHLAQQAQERYVRGEITVDQFETELDQIAREFPGA